MGIECVTPEAEKILKYAKEVCQDDKHLVKALGAAGIESSLEPGFDITSDGDILATPEASKLQQAA